MENIEKEMNEMMVDCFIELEDGLHDKSPKEILLAWIEWIDARYKIAIIPEVSYAIIDCETGDAVSLFNMNLPNSKEMAKNMCAEMNAEYGGKISIDNDDKEDETLQNITDAYLQMDEESFIDFLVNYSGEKEE